MKSTYKLIFLLLLVLTACKRQELGGFEAEFPDPNSVSGESGIVSVSSNNEQVLVTLMVKLAEPAAKAFQVQLSAYNDVLEQRIADGELENTHLLLGESYQIPNVVDIPFGALSASFQVQVNLTTVERNYGGKLALGIRLTEPTKGNVTDAENDVIELLLNTTEVLDSAQIHYLSFSVGGGEVLPVGSRQNYRVTSGGVEIPLGVTLAGVPARSFNVFVETKSDTIEFLKQSGGIPQTARMINIETFSLDTVVRFPGNTSSMPLTLTVPWAEIEEDLTRPIAIAVQLEQPTRHVLHPEKAFVLVLIDPNGVVESDITDNATLSVNRDNGGGADAGEGSKKVVDGESGTKFLTSWNNNEPLWMQLQFPEPTLSGAYLLTSANDAPNRDPKTWELQGSEDGETWIVLDRRENQAFENRFQERRFEFSTNVPYAYYRLHIQEINGADAFQMAEWRLIKLP